MGTRSDTHREIPPFFHSNRLSYRDFNRVYFEPWLQRAYADSVAPFYLQPDPDLATNYLTEFAASYRKDTSDGIRLAMGQHLIRMINDPEKHKLYIQPWHAATVKQREEWLLATWQRQQEDAQESDQRFDRFETPELTLNFAKDPYHLDQLLENLAFDPAVQPYRHVPHGRWDRLHDWTTSSTMTMPSRAVRAFTEDAKIARTSYLFQFAFALVNLAAGLPYQQVKPLRPGLSAEARAELEPGALRGPSAKYCSGCAQIEDDEHPLICCAKCLKKAKRQVWYCGSDCQRIHWPLHKLACGLSLREAEAVAASRTSSKPPPTVWQVANLSFLEEHPRGIWGIKVEGANARSSWFKEGDIIVINLPSFIRPYVSSLEALIAIRTRAIKEKDHVDIGILAYFIRLFCEADNPARATWPPGGEPILKLLADLLEIKFSELQQYAQGVGDRVESGKKLEGVDKHVLSALKQMKMQFADLSLPKQSLTPAAFPFLEGLLTVPSSFYVVTIPTSCPDPELHGHLYPFAVLPSTPTYARSLAAARGLALRVVQAGGTDWHDLGLLFLLACAWMKMDRPVPDRPGAEIVQRRMAEAWRTRKAEMRKELEEWLNLPPGAVLLAEVQAKEELFLEGEADAEGWVDELEGGAGDELELFRGIYRHFLEAPNPELEEMGLLGTAEETASSLSGKKKKNRKKKKKGGKKTHVEAEAEASEQTL
ncbi:hypothetical protein JCM8097_006255 [Rhodosporidiobolus ruineniae]